MAMLGAATPVPVLLSGGGWALVGRLGYRSNLLRRTGSRSPWRGEGQVGLVRSGGRQRRAGHSWRVL